MSIELLKEKLSEYLESKGINPRYKFKCIDPKHVEKTPSSHVHENKIVKCFGCGKVSDIFEVASLLEGLPSRKSPSFFKDNVSVLARRFNLSLGSFYEESGLDIYNEIINICLQDIPSNSLIENVVSWAPDRFKQLQKETFEQKNIILFLKTPPLYLLRQKLIDAGYTSADLNQYGIVKYIFDPETTKFLYPLWRYDDCCVGFMKRQIDTLEPKCLNVPNNPIFVKENYLYGLFLPRKTEDLFIVEGQKDVLALSSQGYDAVGISFSKMTNMQFEAITNISAKRYILALDNDKAGTAGILDGIKLFLKRGIIPWVNVWTSKDCDEDYADGIGVDFDKLTDGVDFLLSHMNLELPETTKEIVTLIASIDSAMVRLSIINIFAEAMRIDKKYLLDDVDQYIQNQKENENNKILNVYKSVVDKIILTPQNHEKIIAEAQQTINTLIKVKKSYDNEQAIKLLESSFKDNVISKASEDFVFRDRCLGDFGRAISEGGIGWSTTGSFILSPGYSHTGKTLLMTQAIAEILLFNEDSMVFLFSTDDSLELLIPRIISSIIAHPAYIIGNYYSKKEDLRPEVFEWKNKAINFLFRLIKENRFIAKDVSYCKTFGEFADLVRHFKSKYPHRKAIIFNDNFHRNADYREKEDLKRIEMSAGDIKNFAVEEGLAVWCTVEKRKPGMFVDPGISFNASNDDILGAGALVYYATHIFHTVNDYVQRGKDIDACVWVHNYQGSLLPQTQIKITKSKSNGQLSSFVFNMYPSSNLLVATDYQNATATAYNRARSLGYIR